MLALAAAALVCKAVLTPELARPCRSFEFDLSLTPDGVLVVSHEPVDRPWSELKGKYLDLDTFIDGLKGRHFDMVDLDLKERSFKPGDGRLAAALARHEPALRRLSAQTGTMLFSTPVPTRFAEVERFLKRSGLKASPSFEIADYTTADAKRWGLPISLFSRVFLPVGRLANAAYRKLRGDSIRYVIMQEHTAEKTDEKATVVCWSRDAAEAVPPAACRWTERALPAGGVSIPRGFLRR